MTKKSKKVAKKSGDLRSEIRRLGVVIEHVDDGVKLVAEQHGDIKGAIVDIKMDITGIKKDVMGISSTLDIHTEMIGKVAVDIEVIKEDIEFMKNSLRKKVDQEEFAALERRVLLLEKHR